MVYAYAEEKTSGAGGRNTVRRTGMVYPGGLELAYEYLATSNRLDDDSSRVTRIGVVSGDGSTPIVEYDYLGVGRVVGTDLLEPEVRWELFEGGSAGDEYPNFDRFTRVEGCQWERYGKGGPDTYVYNESVVYDYASSITSREDNVQTAGAGGTGNGLFDVGYTLDDLHRLTGANEGNWSGSVINNLTRDEQWTLSQTGNAVLAQRDLDGDQNYNEGGGEFDDDRGYNDVNELRTRDVDGTPGTTADNYEPDYDKNGNLVDDDKRTPTGTYTFGYTYKYDAWNRLKEVRKQNGDLVAEYGYNGQGHRVHWLYDANTSGVADGSDPTYHFALDENWRTIETYLDDDDAPKEIFLFQTAGADGHGGSSYIDHVLRAYRDTDGAWTESSDGTFELVADYCHGWRPDVVVVLNASTGAPYEWAKYFSYGTPFGLSIGDTNGTGTVNATDQGVMQGWYVAVTYDVRVDFDGDNDLDLTDFSLFNGSNMGLGVLSRVGNRSGYAGYQHDPGLTSTYYHVRYRVLHSGLGSWMQRDPLHIREGTSLYVYGSTAPIARVDPLGLISQRCDVVIVPDGGQPIRDECALCPFSHDPNGPQSFDSDCHPLSSILALVTDCWTQGGVPDIGACTRCTEWGHWSRWNWWSSIIACTGDCDMHCNNHNEHSWAQCLGQCSVESCKNTGAGVRVKCKNKGQHCHWQLLFEFGNPPDCDCLGQFDRNSQICYYAGGCSERERSQCRGEMWARFYDCLASCQQSGGIKISED